MSRTAVSEFNARMSIDTAPLAQDVTRASALLKRLSTVQAEAFASMSGGPDMEAMTRRMREAAKAPNVLGFGNGVTGTLKDKQAELDLINEIASGHEENLRKQARMTAARIADQERAIAKVKTSPEDTALVTKSMVDFEARHLELVKAREQYEDQIYGLKVRQAALDNQAATTQASAISKSAKESAAVYQAEWDAAEGRLATEKRVLDTRRKIAEVKAAGVYERADPFTRQVLEVKRLNNLLAERRNILRSGGGAEAISTATLAVQKQIEAVRNLRSELTAGTVASLRIGNTAADSQKGFSRFGLGIQQAGYQIQDFAVQVASGTNAMVALSQQGSQLLGFFGGWKGAAAGAALSVGILAYRLYSGEEAAKKQSEALDRLAESYRRIRQSEKEFSRRDFTQAQMAEALAKDAEQAKRRATEISDAMGEARALSAKADEESKFRPVQTLIGGPLVGLSSGINKLTLYLGGVTNAQIGTKKFEEASTKLADANEEAAQAAQKAARATEEYDKALKDAKASGARIGETEFQQIDRLRTEFEKLRDEAKDPLKIQIAENEFRQAMSDYETQLKDTQTQRENLGETEYERVKRLGMELAKLTDAEADRLTIAKARLEYYRASVDYDKQVAAAERNMSQIGETDINRLHRLRKEVTDALSQGKGPLEVLNAQLAVAQQEQQLKNQADRYLDQLDALRKQRRELEEIADLQKEGFFGSEDVYSKMVRNMNEGIERSLRAPAAFDIRGSAQSSGGFVGGGQGADLVSINRSILATLNRHTTYLSNMAGGTN